MYKFVADKKLDFKELEYLLYNAKNTNQFTNGGPLVQELETKARAYLQIDTTKAVIAVNNGTSALHAMYLGISLQDNIPINVATQAFTFPSVIQGPVDNYVIVDLDDNYNMSLKFEEVGECSFIVATNCFGHLQDLDRLVNFTNLTGQKLILDNAATPYSFWEDTNSCNIGTGSFISLHHTKPIGFGEGGLIIVDIEYENTIRDIINFGMKTSIAFGNNYKMSEIAAASILQFWHRGTTRELRKSAMANYSHYLNIYQDTNIQIFPNHSKSTMSPSCFPAIFEKPVEPTVKNSRKYYKPLKELPMSSDLYSRIICMPIA